MLTIGTSVILEVKEWKTNQGSFTWLINFEVQLYLNCSERCLSASRYPYKTAKQGLFIFPTLSSRKNFYEHITHIPSSIFPIVDMWNREKKNKSLLSILIMYITSKVTPN